MSKATLGGDAEYSVSPVVLLVLFHRPDGSLDQNSTKTIPEGAATTVWCSLSAQLDNLGGVYCADCDISPIVPDDSKSLTGVRRWAIDKTAAERLWELSERLLMV